MVSKQNFLLTLALLLVSIQWSTAQLNPSNGLISGVVIDKTNNETLIGVTVAVSGTGSGAATDVFGHYKIELAPGDYELKISYLGYGEQSRQVKVAKGQETIADFSLVSSETEIEAVVIEAKAERSSAGSLLTLQQKSATIISGISQDDIRRSPDRTTGDAIKRVSSASLQDNKFVVIRGLSDRYNASLINGMQLPSSETDRRAFAFDIFPANLLDNLLIYKTASPELPGDFAGGTVMLNTKEIPERNFLSLTLGTAYNTISTFKEYYTYNGGSDWLGFDDGTRALPAKIPRTPVLVDSLADPASRYKFSKIFESDFGFFKKASALPAMNLQLSGGLKAKFGEQGDFGMIGAITYNNFQRLTELTKSDFNDNDTAKLFIYNDKAYSHIINWGAMLNFGLGFDPRNRITFNNVYNVNMEDQLVYRDGTNISEGRYERANALWFTSTRFWSSQLQGEHTFGAGAKFKWGVSLANIGKDVPNLRRMFYTKNIGDPADFTAFVPFGAPSPTYAGRFFSKQKENNYGVNAEVAIPYHLFKNDNSVKVGLQMQSKSREFDARVFGYVISSFQYDPAILSYAQDTIFNDNHMNPQEFRLGETTNPSDSYDAGSFLFAPYVMFDQGIGSKLRISGGLRLELFHQGLQAKNFGGTEIKLDTLYIDPLPSVNIIYNLTETSKLRLSASRTVSRPNFRELAPFAFYDFTLVAGIVGDPDLVPTKVTNVDLRYEIFPGRNNMLAFTAFYKNFKKPIEQLTDAGTGGTSRQYTFMNATGAYNFGGEIEFRMRLGMLTKADEDFLDNFTFTGNFAYIQSRVDLTGIPNVNTEDRQLQGQSPYVANVGLSFQHKSGFGMNVLYNQIGRRIWQVGYVGYKDVYESSRPMLDVQLSQKFASGKGEAKINVTDLLNRRLYFYQDNDDSKGFQEGVDNVVQSMFTGRNVSISLSYKI